MRHTCGSRCAWKQPTTTASEDSRLEEVEGAIRKPAEKSPAKGRIDDGRTLGELLDLTNHVRERREELGAERGPALQVPGEDLGEIRLGFRGEANSHSRSSRRDRTV